MHIAKVTIAQFVTAEEGDAMISQIEPRSVNTQPKCG